jgi:endo-1,4-beta-xylanase
LNNNTQYRSALKDVLKDDFYIGVALNRDQIYGKEPKAMEIVEKHFNSIVSENILKWEEVHPEPDRYNFEPADRFVEIGKKNNMFVVGHCLVWFFQTPKWVFQDKSGKPLSREALLDRMKEHIFTVMGRYKGLVHGWDVVNEAIKPDGSFRENGWLDIIGEDYILKAFKFARQADPTAELYYNDYNMWKKPQYEGVIRLIENLQSKGVRVDGIGIQGHWAIDYPPLDEIETAIQALSKLGVKLMVTELDICVVPFADDYDNLRDISSYDPQTQKKLNPYPDFLPDEVQKKLADRYAELFALFSKYKDVFSRITFWAVHDGQSWRSYMPIRGRTDYPMLFDRQFKPKPAFDAVVKVVRG